MKLLLIILVLQLFVTYQYTNTKQFSIRAFIRNISIGYSLYFAFSTKKYYILLLPIILEICLEYLKYKGIYMDKYIATTYQYSDYWRNINKRDTIFSNFSEANYNKIIGFDTTDLSQTNLKNILNWTYNIYNKSLKEKNHLLTDINGKKHDAIKLKKITDNNKFKLICEKCNIQNGMTILEVGFGEGDLMNYIYEHYNIRPIGVSISSEQVKLVKSRGFTAYEMDAWKMTPEVIGTFDLILQCGNIEHMKCQGEPNEVYIDYSIIIKNLLKPNGKYFVTCIHLNENFERNLYDNLRCYILWSGNDGSYPKSKSGFTKYVEQAGLTKLYQEDRTIDYWITTTLYMSYLQCRKNNVCVNSLTTKGLIDALFKTIAAPYYIHTYLCYSPTDDYFWLPWLWEFVPQERNNKLEFPTTLEYILFLNKI
jgi:cyclopropane fatty-acyl-phospholipid synthase-like methyltransferase